MEIATLTPGSIRIKGKQATCVINPQDKNTTYSFAVLFHNPAKSSVKLLPEALTIDGPGEYEVGGIKISGTTFDTETVYSFLVDDISILLVSSQILAKYHQKLRENDIVLVLQISEDDPSVAVNVADSIVIYTGEKVEERVKHFVKEGLTDLNKYSVTKDKLPTEVIQILLV